MRKRFFPRLILIGALAATANGGLLAQSGAVPAETPLDWRTLVGCYRMDDRQIALDSLPAVFRLLPPAEGARQAWSYSDGENAYWRMISGDTVELTRGNSLHGGRYRWVVRGDSLVGHVDTWTDIAGVQPKPVRRVAHRESCSPDGAPDAPPPHGRALRDSVPAAVAAVIADSLLPRLDRSLPISMRWVDNPWSYSARVAKSFDADAREHRRGDVVEPGTRVHAERFSVARDQLSAEVVTATCEDRPGTNLRVVRTRYRFARAGSVWRFAGTEALGQTDGACRRNRRR